ncbi:hypothetical protein [Phreatobacter stygius]|uniref:Uncharacterized protein n=1 Tax=Phreatobacter stygius TaxID=1940610 RepID=A0A4D7B278_9HYPH|nr:hypothetical protein [Phreatobacter stygius]QCI66921.1 hypothetical protein E8M01_23360 [Phreatobacter stygius]
MRINPEINIWSILATLCMVGAAGLWLQADVRDLKAEDARIIERVKRIEDRTERDRDTIATIQGDIRVIRQILEGSRPRPP